MAARCDLDDAMYERWLRGGCDDSDDSDDDADASDDVAANNLDDDELDAAPTAAVAGAAIVVSDPARGRHVLAAKDLPRGARVLVARVVTYVLSSARSIRRLLSVVLGSPPLMRARRILFSQWC